MVVVAFALPACKKKGKSKSGGGDPSQVVAKVDDAVITVGDVQERINKQSPFVRARYTTNEKKKEFLDSLIRFEVMANEAERRGYDKDPEVLRVMKQQMISKFLQKDFESKLKVEDVPDADVEKYYKEHPEEYNRPDEVRVGVFGQVRVDARVVHTIGVAGDTETICVAGVEFVGEGAEQRAAIERLIAASAS